jgi:hypothetical protein
MLQLPGLGLQSLSVGAWGGSYSPSNKGKWKHLVETFNNVLRIIWKHQMETKKKGNKTRQGTKQTAEAGRSGQGDCRWEKSAEKESILRRKESRQTCRRCMWNVN